MADKQRKRHMEETSSDSNKMPKTTLSLELPPGCEEWKEKELGQFLQKRQTAVKEKKITVAMLKNPNDPELKGLGMSIIEQQIPVQGKVYNDPIHGHVELHPLLVKIINTPQFDRLRHIKQLGGAYYVFPGACHNRFEHSIGVAHLAGQFAQALKSKQPELSITDRDVLCVQIAGLCHDLGHGPFSHLFDQMFIPKARPELKWKHEDHSLKMFDHMVEKNDLRKLMKLYGLEPEEDIKFIKEMIKPPKNDKEEKWLCEGRGPDKSFLYEIVANETNKIDVDKFDYFARDCHHLGIQNHFDHQRFFRFARVCKCECLDGKNHICVRDKEVHNLYEMFYARCSFHRKAYQHKVNKLIETMITDAFLKADEHLKLSQAIDDDKIEDYIKLTDRVFEEILHSSDDELKEAKELLNRIISRDLYKHVGTIVTKDKKMNESVKHKWKESSGQMGELTAKDFALVATSLDYGNGEDDPISKVHFYSKLKPDEAKLIPRDQVSRLLPQHFSEGFVRVYLKRNDKSEEEKKRKENDEKNLKDAKEHFRQWCEKQHFTILQDENQEIIARPNN